MTPDEALRFALIFPGIIVPAFLGGWGLFAMLELRWRWRGLAAVLAGVLSGVGFVGWLISA